MNYQKIDYTSENVKEAAKLLDCYMEELMYYAWPQAFGSTAGPFPGIGGQAISTFTIEAYSDGRDAVLYCGDKLWRKVSKFSQEKAFTGNYR